MPILDSLISAFTKKAPVLLLHFPLAFYTSLMISYQFILKIAGIKPSIMSYGKGEKKLDFIKK